LDRRLTEKRIYPSIDIYRSGTRREELLLSKDEIEVSTHIRKLMSMNNSNLSNSEIIEKVINIMKKTKTNEEFVKVFLENTKK